MKLVIASDIHGSAFWCAKLLELCEKEQPDHLILLGDILYHGPRNDLPRDYAPKQVIPMLAKWAEKILCVRGNCEAEVDQMVLKFPVMADYCVLPLEKHAIYATHGHTHGEDDPLPMTPGDYLLCGHTHVPAFNVHADYTYINPGSTSIPKNGSAHSYMLMDGDMLLWKDLASGEVYRRETIEL